MIHWAQESFIQNPELVRMMFSLLHRQYDGLGELIRALPKAYTINAVSIQDTMDLLECLGQIRSLLIVQMGPEEERLMIQSIGLVQNWFCLEINCWIIACDWNYTLTLFLSSVGTLWVTKFSTNTPTWCELWACMKLSWRSWLMYWVAGTQRYIF